MKPFAAFIIKESRHILRDVRTMLILFAMPVMLMLIFGFAISTDVKDVRAVVVCSSQDHQTARLVQALGQSEYFDLVQTVPTPQAAERLMRDQRADLAIVFPQRFASHGRGIQLLADGADPNMAQQYAAYASAIFASHLSGGAPAGVPDVSVRLLYNPQMKSSYNFVPGIMGMLLMLICAMMTSVSIVREKEMGTMEVLLASPVRPLMVMVAKAVPYLALALCVLASILLIARFVLGVPVAGSLPAIVLLSLLYILLALSLGLLISTVASRQLVALVASAVMLLMPSVLLSGMIYPIESMPRVLQWVSAVVPPRYYIAAMRKLMIMGVGAENVLREAAVLLAMTLFFLTVALLKFKQRLE